MNSSQTVFLKSYSFEIIDYAKLLPIEMHIIDHNTEPVFCISTS